MRQTFCYGKYTYEYYIEFSDRKTLGLMVRPDLRIITKVPYGTSLDEIEAFLRRKWIWLHKTLADLKRYKKKYYEREYVSGESFHYLGRRYMLVVESADQDGVRLDRGKLRVYTTKNIRDSEYNKKLVEEWYQQRRDIVFKRLYLAASKQFGYAQLPQLQQRVMPKRWGSYRYGKVLLNPRLIEAPTEAIYYVLVHELCHVNNKKHDQAFYKELEKRIPNWREIKEKLEIRYG